MDGDEIDALNDQLVRQATAVHPGLGRGRSLSDGDLAARLNAVADEADRLLAEESLLPRETVAWCLFIMRSLVDGKGGLPLARVWHDRVNQTFGPITVTGESIR